MSPIALSTTDLAIASLLVLASAGLSIALSLRVETPLLVSAVRLVVQLVLVGLLLRFVFATANVTLTIGVIALMILAASREVGARGSRRLRGVWQYGLGGVVVTAATLPVATVVLVTALRPTPWYDAQHAIPLVGIILGTVMNAGSLTLNAMLSSVAAERNAIEARLTLGAARQEAFRPIMRRAVLAGILPITNQMAAAGIITLPGIMTGQVLAGMDPLAAAKYQILLMFVLAASALLGSIVAAIGASRRLSDDRHRLRLDRLLGPFS